MKMQCVLVAQSCPTLCDTGDCGPSGSSVCGVLRVGTLEWVAISSSRGFSTPRGQTQVSGIAVEGWDSFHLNHQGIPSDIMQKQINKSITIEDKISENLMSISWTENRHFKSVFI